MGANKLECYEHLREISVTIATSHQSSGSAVIISKKIDGEIRNFAITCTHCIPPQPISEDTLKLPEVVALQYLEKSNASSLAEIISICPFTDICVLMLGGTLTEESTKFCCEDLKPLDELYHMGSFHGPIGHDSISKGFIIFLNRKIKGVIAGQETVQTLDQISNQTVEGSSGGGVFNPAGKCVGIASAHESCNSAFMIPSRVITKYLKDQDLEWLLNDEQPPSLKELEKKFITTITITEVEEMKNASES
jgi:hypothetical protein